MERLYTSHSAKETIATGKQFAQDELLIGSLVVLRGELGAGKTQFAKGIAHAFGIQEDKISSPTYALANEYPASFLDGTAFTLYHLDCYRFETPEELLELGVEEYLYPKNGICIVEWPERIEQYLPAVRIEVALKTLSISERSITISSAPTI